MFSREGKELEVGRRLYIQKRKEGERRKVYIQKGREEEGEVGCKIKIEQDISISLFELCKYRNVGYY